MNISRNGVSSHLRSSSLKVKVKPNGWMRLKLGYAKLNVDASFDVDSHVDLVGAVLRDHTGKIMVAANERIQICLDSFTVEAIEVRFGINHGPYNWLQQD